MSELDDKLPIGAEQVAEATAILQKYKAGKAALDKRIVDNELWFRMGHWKNYQKMCIRDRSRMPKGTSRPRLTVQDQQNGVRVHIPYYTEKPEPDQVQCALAWYTGAFADRERQLGVEILLDALLGTNQSPLKRCV